ncbi:hypothetical protein TVAG_184830 [Trichomonas vaginalis G3]|uniref:Uncharacterized protein n=1 Tax=Trichomonas vaginalis (strain ATCC PRA-98 / G3) TaxID=412133 RepID=A2D8C8_TRIV3|nr:hypothetical protein TVAGG3_0393950 [Trichomonas vaginalis G3]EAY23177.1 hypothetical protein TVAG_184830 [Trichomonas vaginalis G3]KAI5534192.1 hypothetical protein TVAGG3_0393950 [Trichomonas vaginalis G3]|eukprot:XP_001584163.1 hypothetical protein [Trichomonas vaginalis G3]
MFALLAIRRTPRVSSNYIPVLTPYFPGMMNRTIQSIKWYAKQKNEESSDNSNIFTPYLPTLRFSNAEKSTDEDNLGGLTFFVQRKLRELMGRNAEDDGTDDENPAAFGLYRELQKLIGLRNGEEKVAKRRPRYHYRFPINRDLYLHWLKHMNRQRLSKGQVAPKRYAAPRIAPKRVLVPKK